MYSKIISAALGGIHAQIVSVEVDIDTGLPCFSLVGLLNSEVRESKERVSVALKNTGHALPASKITVNLAPADLHKEGTAFDLAISIGILKSLCYFPEEATDHIMFLGELGLNGEIKGVKGVLPIVQAAKNAGITDCIVPADNAAEGGVIPGITVRGAEHILQVIEFLSESDRERREAVLPGKKVDTEKLLGQSLAEEYDFCQVSGQNMAKRAAEIAAAGFHNLLMTGPPGAGKSMIAKRIPGIMPPMSLAESVEVTSVYSVAGQMPAGGALITQRPFQSPHHSVTDTALIGGGIRPRPGLVPLSHRGILFMDEFPEFGRAILESLRQPLEDRLVQISRVGGNLVYPADFMLVAAMNPCPCGYYPDRNRCKCTQPQITAYQNKVSGPVLDRIDLWVELKAVELQSLQKGGGQESSETIRKRVEAARLRQKERFEGTTYLFNSDIKAADAGKYCEMKAPAKRLMETIYENLKLGARGYHRLLKVSRTIADLDGAKTIGEEHLLEAAGYRPQPGK